MCKCVAQAGPVTAQLMSTLRNQPDFLKHVAACISRPEESDQQQLSHDAGDRVQDWTDEEDLAWRIMAEAHAFEILAVEAFLFPRARSGH